MLRNCSPSSGVSCMLCTEELVLLTGEVKRAARSVGVLAAVDVLACHVVLLLVVAFCDQLLAAASGTPANSSNVCVALPAVISLARFCT
jgi:uncharacterized membrane protein (DUF485 family)